MQQSTMIPLRQMSVNPEWSRSLDEDAIRRVKTAARENIKLLRSGIVQCVHIAIEGSEDVAATMIDYAIQLNVQANDAVSQYGVTAAQWNLMT
jgi:hypothetical protein